MLIHIINGTYGHRPYILQGDHKVLSTYVVPTTRFDPPIDVDEKEAERLVSAGIAEYVHKEHVATDDVPSEPEDPNGTIANEEDGGNAPGDGGNESEDLIDDEEILVFSTDMKADELRAAMRERGFTIRVGMTKAEMVEVLNGVGESIPDIKPQDVVEE